MICTNCYEDQYKPGKTELRLSLNDHEVVLRDLDCDVCPACGDITFTHAQSLEIDKKRVALEFGSKPLLTPDHLKILRRVLGMKLDEICDLLHVGRNSYGRWERGEVEITPSMNLLVHNLIEKFPVAAVNLLDNERKRAIEKANASVMTSSLSFGQYLSQVLETTRIEPEVVCIANGVDRAEFVRVLKDAVSPEEVPYEVTAQIASFFRLPFEPLRALLNESLRVSSQHQSLAATVHEESTHYRSRQRVNGAGEAVDDSTLQKGRAQNHKQAWEQYLAKVKEALEKGELAAG